MNEDLQGRWALILGASSGFGAACSLDLARAGMNIFGVHLDLKSTLPNAKKLAADIEDMGRRAIFFNVNAADSERRAKVLDRVQEVLAEAERPYVHCMLHSLAFGTLLPLIAKTAEESVTQPQIEMTLNVMANSLVYWTQDLFWRGLLGRGSRIFGMTSAGSHRVLPQYGAVSAAKAALESYTRQLALELGPHGIMVNCIQAGLTDTPALRKIPGHEQLLDVTLSRHPGGRLTNTNDVAVVLSRLCDPRISWISGTVITVDGGEDALA